MYTITEIEAQAADGLTTTAGVKFLLAQIKQRDERISKLEQYVAYVSELDARADDYTKAGMVDDAHVKALRKACEKARALLDPTT